MAEISGYIQNKILAQSNGFSFEIEGSFEKARDGVKVYEGFLFSFQKTGETPFELRNFEVKNPEKLFVRRLKQPSGACQA